MRNRDRIMPCRLKSASADHRPVCHCLEIRKRPNDLIIGVYRGTLVHIPQWPRWYAVPRKASLVASVWRVCGVFWIHQTLVFSCTILTIGSGVSKNMMIKALWFFTWTPKPNSPGAFVHTQSMLMCQDTATLSLVNTLAHITLWATWYANRELARSLGLGEALKLNILLS